MVPITWLTAFLDAPVAAHDASTVFWRAVTGYAESPRRGDSREFATLVPAVGDAHLRVQRINDGPARVHLDVHVPDLEAAATEAERLGASRRDAVDGVQVMASPGGFVWCLVGGAEAVRTSPADWGGHASLVDQVCLDAPGDVYDVEEAFWSGLTGWSLQERADEHGLRALHRPAGQPLRILLQRLDEPTGPVRAHLDLASDDRDAEVARHEALGAGVVRRTPCWTTLRDPAGLDYCVTDRDPGTGLLRRGRVPRVGG